MRPDRPTRLSRLKQRKDFLAAAAHGRRFRSSAFSAQVRDAAPEEGQDGLRLGLTASRKTGNSVKRNRIRRRLRAAAAIAAWMRSGVVGGSGGRVLNRLKIMRATRRRVFGPSPIEWRVAS